MRVRILSLLVCCVMVLSIFTACGSQSKEEASTQDQATTVESTTAQTDTSSQTQENKSVGNKKIVIVQESKDDVRDATQKKILEALAKDGFEDKKNAEITQIQMEGKLDKSADFVNQIKDIKPDVVIVNSSTTSNETVGKALDGSGIPVVLTIGPEAVGVVDENGKPKGNVTGMYTMPKDLQKSAFELLNKIAPANGKKAVFVTSPLYFKKEDVINNLKNINVELKDYCESEYMEDFQAAVTKYNKDPEVAWILIGVFPGNKKDGATSQQLAVAQWNMANNKKPTVTYWEGAVQLGLLCGLGVDLNEIGSQAGEMAAKILKGAKVADMPAQNPRKVNIVLNQKMAKMLNIQIPSDILGSASKVFDTTLLDSK